MDTNVITVNSDSLVHDVEKIMRENKIRRLPVVDKGKLTGIATTTDLYKITTGVLEGNRVRASLLLVYVLFFVMM